MESFYWVRVHLMVLLWLVMFMKSLCYENLGANSSDVYIVTLKQAPAVHYYGELRSDLTGVRHASSSRLNIHKPRNTSRTDRRYGSRIARVHDSLLRQVLRGRNI